LPDECAFREASAVTATAVESNTKSVWLDECVEIWNLGNVVIADFTSAREFILSPLRSDLAARRTLRKPLPHRFVLTRRNVEATACEDSLSRDDLRSGRELCDGDCAVAAQFHIGITSPPRTTRLQCYDIERECVTR